MKKTFLVFEGLDGTGKTTLAELVAKITKTNYTHNDKCSSYEDGKSKSYNYITTLKNSNEMVIDRLVHTGEAIYAPIYRGYDGSDYFEDLEQKMLEEFNIIIIYIYADREIVKQRLASRGEDYVNIDDYEKLEKNYLEYFKNTNIPFITYDNSKNGALDNAIEVINLIKNKVNGGM